jgi:DNA helicase-2/ATP-dependent DNA helicase PcrA
MKPFGIANKSKETEIIKQCISQLNIDTEFHKPSKIMNNISLAKGRMQTPEEYNRIGQHRRSSYQTSRSVYADPTVKVWELYQQKLATMNLLDFNDLMIKTIEVLRNFPNILQLYQRKFNYIMVDEYQVKN